MAPTRTAEFAILAESTSSCFFFSLAVCGNPCQLLFLWDKFGSLFVKCGNVRDLPRELVDLAPLLLRLRSKGAHFGRHFGFAHFCNLLVPTETVEKPQPTERPKSDRFDFSLRKYNRTSK